MLKRFFVTGIVALAMLNLSLPAAQNWHETLRQQLPLLGHRNWVVIVDSAYPLQTASGIQTLYADVSQLEVVKSVLADLSKTKHIKPIVYTDAELSFVAEKNAPGIGEYREGLTRLLAGRPVQVLPHEQIIAKLDEAGKAFKIVVIKTPLALPYTSVFLQLDCAYWNAEAEQQLRDSMQAGAQK